MKMTLSENPSGVGLWTFMTAQRNWAGSKTSLRLLLWKLKTGKYAQNQVAEKGRVPLTSTNKKYPSSFTYNPWMGEKVYISVEFLSYFRIKKDSTKVGITIWRI
jgi:hypothetical protein